jgi:PAS domain S-box-containing protein
MLQLLLLIALFINIGLSFFLFFVNVAEKDLLHLSIAGALVCNTTFSIWLLVKFYRQYWLPMKEITEKTKEVLQKADAEVSSSEFDNIQKTISILQTTESNIKWQNNGFQLLNELVSLDVELEEFAVRTLHFFTNYLHSVGGCVYMVDDKKEFFVPIASQGFSIQQIQQQDLQVRSGVIGTVYHTQKNMHLKDVQPHQQIESGLFHKKPSEVMILPLSTGAKRYGVLELAFDRPLQAIEIQFIEKTAFPIAAYIADALNDVAIKKLVKQEREINATLQTQEEELRQNLEELHANQLQLDEQIRVTEKVKKELEARMKVLDQSALLTESDLYGNITYVNEKFCAVSKYSTEECLGKPHSLVRHPDTPKEVFKEMWETIKSGQIFRATYANRAKDGSTYWVEANIAPVFDENGKIVKYIGIRFDVTERILREQEIKNINTLLVHQEGVLKQQNQELQQKQQQLEEQNRITLATKNELASRIAVLDQAAIVTESDLYGTITYANQKFCEASGYSLAECIGKPHNINRHPDTSKEVFKEMWDTIKNGGIYKGIIKNKRKDGSPYWVDATIAPVLDENGVPIKYISVRFDITRQITQGRKIENLLQETLLRAKELEAKKQELNQINETLEEKVAERTTELQQQTVELLHKNEQIEGSIRYAKRLQDALLPSVQDLQQAAPNSFIFRLPQHIVSGDFFWVETIKDQIILILADCTGHGVPGAFMTILGCTLLNEIVLQHHITEPAQILYELDKKLSATLRYQTSKYQVADGMDVIVLNIATAQRKAVFAGAKNPIYYSTDGEFTTIKGSKFPIGGNDSYYVTKVFEEHTIDLGQSTVFYLSTDGYQDQIGGEERRKFMTKNFRALLQSIADKPVFEQAQLLEQTFVSWQGNMKQIDDVTVIGLKV